MPQSDLHGHMGMVEISTQLPPAFCSLSRVTSSPWTFSALSCRPRKWIQSCTSPPR